MEKFWVDVHLGVRDKCWVHDYVELVMTDNEDDEDWTAENC